MKSISLTLLLLAFVMPFATASERLPGDSVYHLQIGLTNQSGQTHGLDVYRGHPVLITMFYGSCPAVCPLLIESVRALEKSVDTEQRAELRVLMISIDPARDTPQALAKLAAERKVDTSRWTLARADAAAVRKVAAMLNIQYRQLPNGEFNHSSVITLLSPDGRILQQSSKLGADDAQLLDAIKALN
jgi:protein SCO1/2